MREPVLVWNQDHVVVTELEDMPALVVLLGWARVMGLSATGESA